MTDDHTLARTNMLLVTLIEEVRGLRADITGRRVASKPPRMLSAADVAVLTALLPKIASTIGTENFSVHSLNQDACGRTAGAKALRAALDATGLNALQLGRLLKRAANAETQIEGLYVHAMGASRDGVMFCVDAETRETRMASSLAASLRGTLAA